MVLGVIILVIAAFYAYMVFETTWLKIERLDFSRRKRPSHYAPVRPAYQYDQDLS